MSDISDLKVRKLKQQIGSKYNLSEKEVTKIVDSQFEFAYNKIIKLRPNKFITEEDFKNAKCNFIFSSLMSFVIDPRRVIAIRNRVKNINRVNNERRKRVSGQE